MRKTKLIITLGTIAIIIAGLLMTAGCNGGGEAGSADGGDSGVRFKDLASLTKIAPDDAMMIIYADMKSIMEDTDLGEMYENMESELTDAVELGIAPGDVKHFGVITVDSDEINVIGADLDLDTIYAKLAEEGTTSEDYLGYEVWLGGYDLAMVLMDDTLLMGTEDGVKACLAAIDSDATAYAGNQHVRDVLDRIADGLMMMLMTGEQFYPGSLYAGVTVEKISAENMKMRALMEFADDDEAADIADEINASLGDSDTYNMTVSRSGRFVEFTADVDMEEAGLFW